MLFLYAAIGVCLLIERVVKLLIPLTLAAITHGLIRNPRMLPPQEQGSVELDLPLVSDHFIGFLVLIVE